MSIKASLLLGFFLVAASLLHGGIYSAGHDFVMNRFTGRFEFVPADDEDEDATEAVNRHVATCALTSLRPGVRVARTGAAHRLRRAARGGR
jgi:hypothetical protein